MVAVSDFSGLTSSAWAFAKAEASAGTDSLNRCMARLRLQDIEAHGAGSRALGPYSMPDRLFGVLGDECLELALGPLMIKKGAAGAAEQRGKLRPRGRQTHVYATDCLDPRPRWLGIDEVGRLAGLDAAPEFLFGRYQDG